MKAFDSNFNPAQFHVDQFVLKKDFRWKFERVKLKMRFVGPCDFKSPSNWYVWAHSSSQQQRYYISNCFSTQIMKP